MVHLSGLRQAFLLHLFQLLLCQAVAENWRDYFLGIWLKVFTSRGIIFLGKLEASPVGQGNVNRGIPSFSKAVPLFAALADVLLVGVFPEARGMNRVSSDSGAAFLSSAELPPEGDKNSGKDDEQTQRDTCDGNYIICFLVLSWMNRRWDGRLDSCKKEHTHLSELHWQEHFGI